VPSACTATLANFTAGTAGVTSACWSPDAVNQQLVADVSFCSMQEGNMGIGFETCSPITEAATFTERFRRVNYGQLDIECTLNDSNNSSRRR